MLAGATLYRCSPFVVTTWCIRSALRVHDVTSPGDPAPSGRVEDLRELGEFVRVDGADLGVARECTTHHIGAERREDPHTLVADLLLQRRHGAEDMGVSG